MGDVTHYHGAKSPTDLCQNTPHSSSFLFPSLQTNLFCLNPFLSLPLNSNPALITLFYYILHLCRREDTHAYTHANACIHTAFSGSLSVFIPFYLLSGEKNPFITQWVIYIHYQRFQSFSARLSLPLAHL